LFDRRDVLGKFITYHYIGVETLAFHSFPYTYENRKPKDELNRLIKLNLIKDQTMKFTLFPLLALMAIPVMAENLDKPITVVIATN